MRHRLFTTLDGEGYAEPGKGVVTTETFPDKGIPLPSKEEQVGQILSKRHWQTKHPLDKKPHVHGQHRPEQRKDFKRSPKKFHNVPQAKSLHVKKPNELTLEQKRSRLYELMDQIKPQPNGRRMFMFTASQAAMDVLAPGETKFRLMNPETQKGFKIVIDPNAEPISQMLLSFPKKDMAKTWVRKVKEELNLEFLITKGPDHKDYKGE